MTPPPIPLLRAQGSHADVGRQIGSATAETVRRFAALPYDPDLVRRYRAVTVEHLPWVVEELDGVAEGAGIDPLAVFAASIEELAPAELPTGCSDLVVTGKLSANGHLLVAHNNDLYAEDEEDLVAIEWRVPGEPVVFTLGNGPWLSVAWNDAGLSVTGNELSPNDERIGIPRLLQMRAVTTRRTLAEAVEAVLHPARASSYNWVFAHRSDGALNVEGSATEASVEEPGPAGFLAHTNHYASSDMQRFETHGPLRELLHSARTRTRAGAGGRVDGGDPAVALADHANGPDSICRHSEPGKPKEVKTVFWCVADVTAGEITYGRGNPCDSEAQVYRFGV